jgi:hypothetical protein
MPVVEIVTAVSLWELVKHGASWLVNLKNAKKERKRESTDALRKVLLAAQETRIYTNRLKNGGDPEPNKQERLAMLWSELSFALEDLGLDKLAKRCRIKGLHWADPGAMDQDYLEKADIGLERMERLARQVLLEIRA